MSKSSMVSAVDLVGDDSFWNCCHTVSNTCAEPVSVSTQNNMVRMLERLARLCDSSCAVIICCYPDAHDMALGDCVHSSHKILVTPRECRGRRCLLSCSSPLHRHTCAGDHAPHLS